MDLDCDRDLTQLEDHNLTLFKHPNNHLHDLIVVDYSWDIDNFTRKTQINLVNTITIRLLNQILSSNLENLSTIKIINWKVC